MGFLRWSPSPNSSTRLPLTAPTTTPTPPLRLHHRRRLVGGLGLELGRRNDQRHRLGLLLDVRRRLRQQQPGLHVAERSRMLGAPRQHPRDVHQPFFRLSGHPAHHGCRRQPDSGGGRPSSPDLRRRLWTPPTGRRLHLGGSRDRPRAGASTASRRHRRHCSDSGRQGLLGRQQRGQGLELRRRPQLRRPVRHT